MKWEDHVFHGSDGLGLHSVRFLPETEPKVILQVVHGMTEHMGRYKDLARSLTAQGVLVAGFDLRGHGRNPGDSRCANFGTDGWDKTLEDIRDFSKDLRKDYPGIPLVLLGFSLGSFLVRDFLSRVENTVDGVILAGTGDQPGLALAGVKKLVEREIQKVGFDHSSPMIEKLTFGLYNQKFRPNRTEADWLTSDRQEAQRYLQDPLCRKELSAGLFWQMLDAMQRCAKGPEHWKPIPILILSGDHDPVGDMGKGIERMTKKMKDLHPQICLVPKSRHDLFHEISSGGTAVTTLTIQFFLGQFGKK